jgi:hypothetical protein
MFRKIAGACVSIATSWLVIRAVRLMTWGMRRGEKKRPLVDTPSVPMVYSLDNPDGVFFYGVPASGVAAMVLPATGGGWQWRVGCGDLRQAGVEKNRGHAKAAAFKALESFERVSVQ